MPEVNKVSIEPKVPSSSGEAPKKVVKKIIKKKVVKKVPSQTATATASVPQPSGSTKKKSQYRYATGTSDTGGGDVPLERRNRQLLIAGYSMAVIVIVSTVFIFVSRLNITKEDGSLEDIQDLPEVVEEVEPIETTAPVAEDDNVEVVDREDISLEILNGSGTAGLAGDTQEEFEDLGYVVDSIGNSDEIEESELYISEEYSLEELANLLEDVERRLGIEKVTEVDEDLEVTARIILGQDQ